MHPSTSPLPHKSLADQVALAAIVGVILIAPLGLAVLSFLGSA